MPVVSGTLVELLVQFERDLGVLESTLRLHYDFVPVLADDHCGFRYIPDLPGGEAHTYKCMSKKNIDNGYFSEAL